MINIYKEAAVKSYENALDLQKDAKLLYNKKRFARAYSLSVLSIEELSKAYLYKGISERRIDEKQVKKFKKAILNHSLKLGMFSLLLGYSQLSSDTVTYLKTQSDIKKDYRWR